MESLVAGTLAGSGSFRCEECGHVVTLAGHDALPSCPGCLGNRFVRASLFADGRFGRGGGAPGTADTAALVAEARERMDAPGPHLAWRADGEVHVVALVKDWTRIGRSLAADVRFDDPTVSRRHALLVRQPDGIRVVDDRSLNGVFVNGRRVEWRTLRDGDEIVVGRYRLCFLDGADTAETSAAAAGGREGAQLGETSAAAARARDR